MLSTALRYKVLSIIEPLLICVADRDLFMKNAIHRGRTIILR